MKIDSQPFHCSIFYNGEKSVMEDASMVVLPAQQGQMAVLQGHKPLIAELSSGIIEVLSNGGEKQQYHIDGGLAHIRADWVQIICNGPGNNI